MVVGGLDTRDHGPAELAAVAGSLFQDPETQVVLTTVRAELAFPLENRGAGPAAIAREVEDVALALGIEGLLERSTAELSGGELQRVALGAALAARPRLLLLDEPTSQLDPVAGDELLWLLRRLNEEWGTTVLLAEHRLERCLAHADRLVVLRDGRIACDDEPARRCAGARDHAPVLETPAARLVAWPASRRRRAASRTPARRCARRAAAERPAATTSRPGRRGRGGRRDRAAAPAPAARRRGARASPRATSGRSCAAAARSCAASTSRSRPASASPCSAATARASRPCCATSPGCRPRRAGASRRPGASASCSSTPATTSSTSASRDEAPPAALEAVGLAHAADRHPRDLSGGERQRLALAIVAAGRAARRAAARRAHPRHGPRREGRARRAPARGWRPPGPPSSWPPTTWSSPPPSPPRAVLLADGRPVADDARPPCCSGRLALRDGDRARPGRRRRRADARRGRRAARGRAPAPTRGPRPLEVTSDHELELASFAVLALALGAGFVWWERHRPSSRVLALVATLAALAALGRVAFAPLPNVKPTTDIALLSGYVLGGAPGFAVGAIGALASNLVFGQGPWTPWQMAAWGLCGIAGAGLARVARPRRRPRRAGRRLRRGRARLRRDPRLLRLGDVLRRPHARPVPRALRRLAALQRRPRRRQRRLLPRLRPGLRAGAAALPRAARRDAGRAGAVDRRRGAVARRARAGRAASPRRAAQASATSRRRRLPRPGPERRRRARRRARARGPRGLYSSWAAIGLGAAHRDPDGVRRGAALAGRLRRRARRRACAAPGTSSARSSPCAPPARPASGALRGRMHRGQRRDGSWDGLVNLTAFGVLAVRAAGDGPRSAVVRRAAALLARAAEPRRRLRLRGPRRPAATSTSPAPRSRPSSRPRAPRGARAVARAARFLAARQNADGGFGQGAGARSNAQSTAFAVQGLLAAGRSPGRLHRRGARSPLAYLRSLQSASTAPSATRARAPRRRSGSPPRRSPRWPGVRCRSAGDDAASPRGPPRPRRPGAPRRAAARRIG